jgi:hypothetical protein
MYRDRFSRLYTTGHGTGYPASIIERLEAHGISLEFPGTSRVMQIGAEGQEPTARPVLLRRFGSDTDVSFKLWRSTCEDVYCRVRQVLDAMSIDFGMDGMDRADMESFTRCILDVVSWLAKGGVLIGAIIDRTGSAAEEDWDSFFLKDGPLPQLVPSVLGVKKPKAEIVSKELKTEFKEEINGFFLFRSL